MTPESFKVKSVKRVIAVILYLSIVISGFGFAYNREGLIGIGMLAIAIVVSIGIMFLLSWLMN